MDSYLQNSPQILLNKVAEQSMTRELAIFTAESQMKCQSQCEDNILLEQDTSDQTLTQDSILALEKQCNKLCIQKYIRAYHFMY